MRRRVVWQTPQADVVARGGTPRWARRVGGYAARRKNTEDGLAVIGKPSWRDATLADVEARWDALGDPVNRRSRHVVGEIARTVPAAGATIIKV